MFFICVVGLKQDLARRHKDALQTCKSHNLALVKSNQQAEVEVRLSVVRSAYGFCWFCVFVLGCASRLQALEVRVREEQRMMDRKIVAEIDQKVVDQQNTLEKAGVPGFFITTNPQVSQLYLLQLAFHFTFNFDAKNVQQMAMFTVLPRLRFILGADNADEPAGTDPEASAEGVPVLNSLRK